MDFDDVLKDIGEFGPYQQLLLVTILLPPCIAGAFHGFSQIFTVGTPDDFWCRLPQADLYGFNQSEIHKFLPLEIVDGKEKRSQCFMYDAEYSKEQLFRNWTDVLTEAPNGTVPCQYGWDYDRSVYHSTIVTDWNLVCDKSFLPTLSLFIHTLGTLLGTVVSGYLTDEIGRKKTFFIAAMLQLSTGLLTVVSPGYVVFCVVRFFNGVSVVPVWLIPLVMALEFTGPSKRAPVGTTTALVFTCGVVGLAGLAWAVRDWVYLQLAVTVPFVILIADWWVMPESPRWLMSAGRFDEMMVTVRKMAKMNKADLPEDYFVNLRIKCETAFNARKNEKKPRICDVFKTPNLRKKSCLIIFNSFANYAVYSGLNFFVPYLGGSEHINFLLSAVIELAAYPVMYLTLNRFGRRPLLVFSMVFGGAFMIAAALVPETGQWTVLLLFLTSKFCMTFSFFVTDLVASELFPTVVRGAGASLTQTISTIGLCLSPLVAHLGSHSLYLPLVIFGIVGILGGMVTLLLPETLNQNLPETMEEAEAFGKDMTLKQCLTLCGSPMIKEDKAAGLPHDTAERTALVEGPYSLQLHR